MENQLSSSGICPRIYVIADSPKDLQDRNIEPEHVEGRINFMSTFNDIGWTRKEMKRIVFQIQNRSRSMRKDCRKDTGRSSVLEAMTVGKVGCSFEHEGKWDSIASQMVERLKETSDLVFKGASASSLGILRRKTHRDTIHVNADAPTKEL